MVTKIEFLSPAIFLMVLLGSHSSAPADDFKRCGVRHHVPALLVVDKVLGRDSIGQVYADFWVTMNPNAFVILDMKTRPVAVTQFSGTFHVALPGRAVRGIGASVSSEWITATAPVKIRITLNYRPNWEKFLAGPASEMEVWVCDQSITYDDGTSIIRN
ncbi:hypothetical protein B5M44_11735 [Shinella sumterensis]|nr:hypothetical protein B5M44_11735 [Shinella sumterensis]